MSKTLYTKGELNARSKKSVFKPHKVFKIHIKWSGYYKIHNNSMCIEPLKYFHA